MLIKLWKVFWFFRDIFNIDRVGSSVKGYLGVSVYWIPLVLTLRLPPFYLVGVGVSWWLWWIYFGKSDAFGLVGFSRSFLPLVVGSICAYKSLLLALVLSLLSHVSHFEGDVSVIFLRGLIEVIFLFKGVKRCVFSCKLYKKRFYGFWLLIIKFFREKYLKLYFVNVFWEGEF